MDENKRRDKIIKNRITINVHIISNTISVHVVRVGISRINQRINNHHTKQQHRLENKLKRMLQLDGMKMNFSRIYTIESANFHDAWYEAIQNVLKQPQTKLTFGSKEYIKNALDSIQTTILTGMLSSQAIGQIENRTIS